MSKKLEKILQEKLSVKTDQHFEENFFKKFHNEFPIKEVKTQNESIFEFFKINLLRPIPVAMACVLLVTGVVVKNKIDEQRIEYSQIAQLSPVLEDLDMLASVDQENDEAILELSDEEWNLILSES